MDINAGIIDQHVRGIVARLGEQIQEELDRRLDENRLRAAAFVLLCVKVMLDLEESEAIARITEGGNDFGVDAIDIGPVISGEFTVTLFQGKYVNNLEGRSNFPAGGVEKAVQAVQSLFDPHARLHLNPRLQPFVEDVRSLILDGNLPNVRVLLCNNGLSWKLPEAQAAIDAARFPDRVSFQHVNHEVLLRALGAAQPIRDTIRFFGRTIVEDLNYVRVLIGRVPVVEIARLMSTHGDKLLDRNVRRYLGLVGNRVNEGIRDTLRSGQERASFFFYNNGITLVCERFDYNALQPEHHQVRVEALQIINGAQTSRTIQHTLDELRQEDPQAAASLEHSHVLVRLYQVPRDAGPDVQRITYATNSQNPVDIRDLRSGDERQRRLELGMRELGYEYRRQRSEQPLTPRDITVAIAAEAVLAVWRERPQRAKFRGGDHFGTLYDDIFTADLNAAQVVLATLLFRISENKRKRLPDDAPEFVRYASYFIAMLMGRQLLAELGVGIGQVDHRSFEQGRALIERRSEVYFENAVADIAQALGQLYGRQEISPHRLSATFRRGDLLEYLGNPAQQAR